MRRTQGVLHKACYNGRIKTSREAQYGFLFPASLKTADTVCQGVVYMLYRFHYKVNLLLMDW